MKWMQCKWRCGECTSTPPKEQWCYVCLYYALRKDAPKHRHQQVDGDTTMIQLFIALFVLAYFYIGWRFIKPLRIAPRWKWALWAGLLLGFLTMIAGVRLGRNAETPGNLLSWVSYVLMGLLSTLFFLLLIRDMGLLISRGIAKLRSRPAAQENVSPASAQPVAKEREIDKERRAHLLQLTNIGVVGLTGVITSYGIYEARKRPGIVNISVPIERLPRSFAGFRIVQITDVHAGLTVGREWIEGIAEEVHALKPDLIAFTGDMVDGSVANLRNAVAPLGELQAPFGKFFVTGNHEYYSGVEEWLVEVERLGYDVLLNEHRIIERGGDRLVLGGVTDFTGGRHLESHRSDPAAAFRNAPPEMVRIFMAHQPKTLLQTDGVDFDLMLSGHTHGGQFFPWHLATATDQPYLSGLHRPNGKWIYVSKGTGYWGPPVRLGARSEITVITLV